MKRRYADGAGAPENRSAALLGALAWVLLVVGGNATFQAAFLAVASGETHALWGGGTGGGFAVGFGSDLVSHV
jgi:hypothetical protein